MCISGDVMIEFAWGFDSNGEGVIDERQKR